MSEWETITPNKSSDDGWETIPEKSVKSEPKKGSLLKRALDTTLDSYPVSFVKESVGAVAEPILSFGSGLIAKPVSEVAGLAAVANDLITGNKEGDPTGFKNYLQDKLTYEPKTGAGSSKFNPLNFIPQAIGEAITGTANIPANIIAGDSASNTTRGALGNLTREAIPQALGFLGVKKAPVVASAADDFLAKREAALAKKGIDRSVKDKAIKEAQDAGFKLTPATADAGLGLRVAEGIAGSPKLQQGARIKNVEKASELIKKDVGLDPLTPLSRGALEEVIAKQGKVYEELRGAGNFTADADYAKSLKILRMEVKARDKFKTRSNPEFNSVLEDLNSRNFSAEDAVDLMKDLRSEASANLRASERGATSKSQQLALGQFQKKAAKALEDMVNRNLEQSGRGDLAARFAEARKTIAKSKNYLKAIDEHGNIDARKLGDLKKGGAYFTDEGAKVANFGAGFPELSSIPRGSNNVPITWTEAGIGLGGLPLSKLALLYPAVRIGGRSALLSNVGQKSIGNRSYAPGAISRVGRDIARLPKSLQEVIAFALSQERGERQE